MTNARKVLVLWEVRVYLVLTQLCALSPDSNSSTVTHNF